MPDLLRRAFGKRIFADPDRAFDGILQALEAYEQRYTEFYPYSSKYDAYLAGKAELTASEARGLALFNDPEKGNCAHCHLSARSNDGAPPQFTDYGLIALGVPRNPAIPANADPSFHDLGLCGPLRRDLAGRGEYCGLFRTPTLRNVALRRAFFHNGVFHTLRQVLEFYVERDTNPEKWYPRDGRRHGAQVRRPAARSITPTSISSRRSIGTSATSRGYRARRSTTSSRSCTR